MTQGIASDINGDDTVMRDAEATICIDISQLQPSQALAIAREGGLDQLSDETLGALVKGEMPDGYVPQVEFHIPIEAALTALDELNVIGQPPTAEDEEE